MAYLVAAAPEIAGETKRTATTRARHTAGMGRLSPQAVH